MIFVIVIAADLNPGKYRNFGCIKEEICQVLQAGERLNMMAVLITLNHNTVLKIGYWEKILYRRRGQALEQAPQGSVRTTTPEVSKKCVMSLAVTV